jgi:hypothetical protein
MCAKATARLPKIQDRETKVEARITKRHRGSPPLSRSALAWQQDCLAGWGGGGRETLWCARLRRL